MTSPAFWKTDLAYIEETVASAARCAEKRILCKSAGGRPVYMLAYGEKKKTGTANYSSALGALDKTYYCPTGQKPCVILIGAVLWLPATRATSVLSMISPVRI